MPEMEEDYKVYVPVVFGATAIILNFMAYLIVRKVTFYRTTPRRMWCCAWTCVMTSLLLLSTGGFEIYVVLIWRIPGQSLIGFLTVLSGFYWLAQGIRYQKNARTQSAGYQAFNHDDDSSHRHREEPERRRSNAPLIVEVDSNNPAISIERDISSSLSVKSSGKSGKARYSQPLIRNAVPPSPFIGTQGTDSYVAIPMSITKTQPPRSDSNTPQGTGSTLGHLDLNDEEDNDDDIEMNDTLTEQHAEDSIYIEEEEEEDGSKVDEVETPMGSPERKTSEGNDTMCWSFN